MKWGKIQFTNAIQLRVLNKHNDAVGVAVVVVLAAYFSDKNETIIVI